MRLVRSRPCRALLAAAGVLTALALPASASALTFHIVNESGKPASEVFVDISAGGEFNVPGFTNNVPVALSRNPERRSDDQQADQRSRLHRLRRARGRNGSTRKE